MPAMRRPKNLNLLTIHFPWSAIMSIGHRLAGIVLVFCIPYLLYLFELSLKGETEFLSVQMQLQQPLVKLLWLTIIVAISHHFFAGIRFLLLDIELGVSKCQAQKTAIIVLLCTTLSAFIVAFLLFL